VASFSLWRLSEASGYRGVLVFLYRHEPIAIDQLTLASPTIQPISSGGIDMDFSQGIAAHPGGAEQGIE